MKEVEFFEEFQIQELEKRFEMGWIRFQAQGEVCVHFDSDGNAIYSHDLSDHESAGGGSSVGVDGLEVVHEK